MKKFIIIIALIVGTLVGLSPAGSWLAEKGLKEKDPSMCMTGATLKKFTFHGEAAADIYLSIVKNFPDSPEAESALYKYARFIDSDKQEALAIQSYQRYMDTYPEGEHFDRCKKFMANLKANSGDE